MSETVKKGAISELIVVLENLRKRYGDILLCPIESEEYEVFIPLNHLLAHASQAIKKELEDLEVALRVLNKLQLETWNKDETA